MSKNQTITLTQQQQTDGANKPNPAPQQKPENKDNSKLFSKLTKWLLVVILVCIGFYAGTTTTKVISYNGMTYDDIYDKAYERGYRKGKSDVVDQLQEKAAIERDKKLRQKVEEKAKTKSSTEKQDTSDVSYDQQTFTKTFAVDGTIENHRAKVYEVDKRKITTFWHGGGERIDGKILVDLIDNVVDRMPNIPHTAEVKQLLLETLIVESGAGREKHSTGITKWKNYGIAQFRIDTAKDTLWWLDQVRSDAHLAIMELYDKKSTLEYNLTYNKAFSIGLMAQYYWRRIPDLQSNLSTVALRGEAWKAAYNTKLGLGTVNKYISRTAKEIHHFDRFTVAER